jgi:hypothetical protein
MYAEQLDVNIVVASAFEEMRVRYFLGGSMASSAHGIYRAIRENSFLSFQLCHRHWTDLSHSVRHFLFPKFPQEPPEFTEVLFPTPLPLFPPVQFTSRSDFSRFPIPPETQHFGSPASHPKFTFN